MIKINVIIENKSWKKKIKNPKSYLALKSKILSKKIILFKKCNCDFSILLSGNKEIKKLNEKFRKKDKITDVLSFPFHEPKNLTKLFNKNKNVYLGDVVVNFYKINKDSFKIEFDKLWIHGLLHLIGYRHKIDRDYNKMSKLENSFLKILS